MLWLAVEVAFRFDLLASIAFSATREIVVLALPTHPATVRKIEVAVCLGFYLALLLVLGPLGGTGMVLLLCGCHLLLLRTNRGWLLSLLLPALLLNLLSFSLLGHEESSIEHKLVNYLLLTLSMNAL